MVESDLIDAYPDEVEREARAICAERLKNLGFTPSYDPSLRSDYVMGVMFEQRSTKNAFAHEATIAFGNRSQGKDVLLWSGSGISAALFSQTYDEDKMKIDCVREAMRRFPN
jgi:hypothetical protein